MKWKRGEGGKRRVNHRFAQAEVLCQGDDNICRKAVLIGEKGRGSLAADPR